MFFKEVFGNKYGNGILIVWFDLGDKVLFIGVGYGGL